MSTTFSRRTLARLFGASAAAASLPSFSFALPESGSLPPVPNGSRSFPQGFLWGSATASYQVEGAVNEDGRGPSIWDTFAHTPGKVANGDTGDVADDFYHRFPEDIALMKDLGLKGFRFSVAWTRIFPTGTGAPNQKGVDFYKRLVDALLAAGIEPYCTLFHWDLPQPLEDRGGWQSRETAEAYARYAGFMAKHLSDRVSHFMTMNEIQTFVDLGYALGTHAPGLKLDRKGVALASFNAVLGHGLGVQAIRANVKSGTQVGLADNAQACIPVYNAPEHVAAAKVAMREQNARFLTAILEGRYTDRYLQSLGPDVPKYSDADMHAIGSPLDFVGLNCYQPAWVSAPAHGDQGYTMVPNPHGYPTMASPWLSIGPEALYWFPKIVHENWHPKALYITENGASSNDVVNAEGQVLDTDRTMYLRNYLSNLQRAVAEGVPVKGYFCWSLLDNFEWADGYGKRFGIVYVDFATQKRTPKLSAHFYKQTVATNTVA